ncbi:hypothetical protein NDU88_002118 [Pleurodeles waltl]|uniref:Uncharacterized protein n=1 Tax=Pleurodeles waltl TaxID=8319 RepID=A0AAV7WQQ7_PLEWA|nr:hypothetical protein NDU88_002118 [Pleurodeles waltl]
MGSNGYDSSSTPTAHAARLRHGLLVQANPGRWAACGRTDAAWTSGRLCRGKHGVLRSAWNRASLLAGSAPWFRDRVRPLPLLGHGFRRLGLPDGTEAH